MLSQRVFKEWLLATGPDTARLPTHSIDLFRQSIEALIDGGRVNMSLVGERPDILPPAPDEQTRAGLIRVKKLFDEFVGELESLSRSDEQVRTKQSLAVLNENILLAMDENVSALQRIADERVYKLKYLHYIILIVTCVLFTVTMFFIYNNITKPLNNFIDQQEIDYRELNRLYGELEDHQSKLKEQLELGRKVQQRILPARIFAKEGLTAQVLYQPLQTLGGDYYDFFKLEDDKVGILIADAMGKGVSAALMTAMAKVVFSDVTQGSASPVSTLAKVNRLLYRLTGGDSYLTACYLVIDRKNNSLTYAGAGHPAGLVYSYQDETQQELVSADVLIGIADELEITEAKLDITGKTRILLYTDGVTEQVDESGKPIGTDFLKLLFFEQLDQDQDTGLNNMMEKFRQKADNEQKDDITMMLIDLDRAAG